MSPRACITFTAVQWDEFISSLGSAFFALLFLTWFLQVNWLDWSFAIERRLRRRARRRRFAAIRAQRPAVVGVIPDTEEGRQ